MADRALAEELPEDFVATLRLPQLALAGDARATIRPEPLAAQTGERSLVGDLPTLDEGRELKFEGVLGEGGMGVVHEAVQLALGRRVAVKSLKPQRATPQGAVELLREARGTGSLEHPNIVPVYALCRSSEGEPLLVMRKVEGTRLADLLRSEGPSASGELLRRRVRIVVQVCHALAFAHSRGVVHRDVKPDNVMIGAFGEVVLLDWGVAMQVGAARLGGFQRAEELSGLAGTPAYMAPEQVRPKPDRISERTDVFLAGALLHEVVTGAPPNRGTNVHAVLYAASQAAERAYPSEVDPELAAILMRALAADPLGRFASARDLGDALEAWLEHEASIGIAQEGRRTLALAQAESAPDIRHRRLDDARIAFELALRSWPANPDAKRGLGDCLKLKVAQYFDEKNLGEARRLLALIDAPDEALLARERALAEAEAAEAARLAALERLQRDLDLSSTRRSRTAISLLLGGIWAALPAAVQLWVDHTGYVITNAQSVVFGIPLFLVSVGVVFLAVRRELLGSGAGLRLVALLMLSVLVALMVRSLAWMEGVPLERALSFELAGYALLLLTAAVTVRPVFARGALGYGLAAVWGALDPAHAFYATALGNALGLVAILPAMSGETRARSRG